MTTHLPLLPHVADDHWHSALMQQLETFLPTCRLRVDRTLAASRPLATGGSSEHLQNLVTCVEEPLDQAHIRAPGQDFLLTLRVFDPPCTITIEYPLEGASAPLWSHLRALLVAIVTQAVHHVGQTAGHRESIIRQRQQQRELSALQHQLQANAHETTELLAQLRHQDSDYVATLEREVARQTVQLQESNARLQAADAAKSQFLTLMSHELRTPLNGILGMSGLLLNSPQSDEQREYIEAIHSAGQELLKHVNDLLDFSHIETSELSIDAFDFNLRHTLEDVFGIFSAAATCKGLHFAEIVHAHVPLWVNGDPGRLRQVLSCLLDNAVKFTTTGEIIVKVTCTEQTPEDVLLYIEVTDTGMGMAPEAQDRLFEPFTQLDSSSTRQHEGMGLGLALTYQLVTRMGGTMGVTSTLGHGSTFWAIVQLKKCHVPPYPQHRASFPSVRVLVADGQAGHRPPMVDQLRALGMQAEEAESGPHALNLIWQAQSDGFPYQVIFVDDLLPGMHGLALARAIQEEAQYAPSHIVLMSAAGYRGQSRDARQAGIAAYLPKPIDSSSLAHCLTDLSHVTPSSSLSRLISRHSVAEIRAQQPKLLLISAMESREQRDNLRLLVQCGYRVDVVESVCDAIDAAPGVVYDGIVIDCDSPNLDAHAVTAAIRQHETSRSRHIPTIALTTETGASAHDLCHVADVEVCVPKPVVLDEFDAVLAAWVPCMADSEGVSGAHHGA